MPISLIRNTKDNAMHGTDNDRYTGCRMKMQGGTWFTREGELKDITDLTCDRCKEVFATKMIRESNKEELRIAKEEKKRFQRAKKMGSVKEATYEEYLMNRESEESARRASRNDAAVSSSLQMLRDSIPSEQVPQNTPAYNSYNSQSQYNSYSNSAPQITAPQSPFDPYAQPAQSVSAPQGQFNPYAQSQQTPIVSAPQAPFDPYAYAQPAQTVSIPQAPFDPYAQSQQTPVVSVPQAPFDPYAYAQPQQNTFNSFSQPAPDITVQQNTAGAQFENAGVQAPADETPTPQFQEYTGAASISTPADNSVSPMASSDDDFLSQFMVKPAPAQEAEPAAPSSSVTAENIVSATDDILSQFNIGSNLAENTAPVQPAPTAARADASSFFNDSIPVIGAEYAGASSVNSVVTEFGSLNITEEPKDDFVVPNVPVYQPGGNTYVSSGYGNSVSSLVDDFASSSAPAPESTNSFMNNTPAFIDDDILNGFGEAASYNSTSMTSSLMMDSFETPSQSAPTMGGFESVSPVQPAAPAMGGFDTVSPVQPAAPAMGGFGAAPVQPNTYGTQQNSFGQPNMYQQPAANAYQNPYAAPVQSNTQGFQMPQGFGAPVQQPVAAAQPFNPPPKQAPVQTPVFGGPGATADSIEDALRQLGQEVQSENNNQMPEKEEITPDFVAYVPSSSKVLHTSAPSASSANAPKRPVSAREAKQLAKIDAKFKKDLISRGFNPTEIKNGRRGK